MIKHKKRIPLLLPLLITVLLCAVSCEKDAAPSADNEAEAVSYTIVRPDPGTQEEIQAAIDLRTVLRDTYGIEIDIEIDWVNRGENVEDHRFANEILVGSTNRPESIEASAALNAGTRDMLDYIITSNDNHYVITATSGNMEAAIQQFLTYLDEDPALISKKPIAVSEYKDHVFPLDDITVCGVSIFDYDAIVYPKEYDSAMESEVSSLSSILFSACGVNLPLQTDGAAIPERIIRFGARADAEVNAAGEFSYAVVPTAKGLSVDGRDQYSDACALDVLREQIEDGIAVGGTLAIDEPYRRLSVDPSNDFQIAAWVIASPIMTEEAQIAEIKECGFNQIIISRPSDAAEFHNLCKWMTKYELKGLWQDGALCYGSWNGNAAPYVNAA
nr:hypothetical protein [Clostridia bacterium]